MIGKSLFQLELHILKKAFEEKLPKHIIIRLFENQNEITGFSISPISIVDEMAKSDVECNFYQFAEDVPDPRDLSPEKKSLVVFDDLLLEKQNTCESYCVRGRNNNVHCFYLAQKYFKLPHQTIGENGNFICLFPQDLKNQNHIFEDHVGSDMTKEEFRQLCKVAWEKQHGLLSFMIAVKTQRTYRNGLDGFYIPNETLKKIYYFLIAKKMEQLLKQIVNNTDQRDLFHCSKRKKN